VGDTVGLDGRKLGTIVDAVEGLVEGIKVGLDGYGREFLAANRLCVLATGAKSGIYFMSMI
jgi:hypothetical protein